MTKILVMVKKAIYMTVFFLVNFFALPFFAVIGIYRGILANYRDNYIHTINNRRQFNDDNRGPRESLSQRRSRET